MLPMTQVHSRKAKENNQGESDIKIAINFYANKLGEQSKKMQGYCIVMQPVIILKNDA